MKIIQKGWLGNRSVFLKLISIIIIAVVLVNLAVILFIRQLAAEPTKFIQRIIQQNIHDIIEKLGDPPRYETAMELKQKLGILIRFQGESGSWSVYDKIPPLDQIRFEPFNSSFGIQLGRHEFRHYFIVKKKNDYFILTAETAFRTLDIERNLLFLVVLLSAILVIVYITLRKMLHPIQSLKNGVQQVEMGNLDCQLPVKKHDELGELSQAFNTMTQAIKENLHSKKQLLLNVSHELRSPLTRMKIVLEFMDDDSNKRKLREDIQQMEKMISGLLESARLDSEYGQSSKQKTDLREVLNQTCDQFIGRHPGIEKILPSAPVVLFLDSEQIKTLLANVLENAIKYSSVDSSPVSASMLSDSTSVSIVIKDSGEGIPAEDLPYIFEPFYRVDKSRSKKTGGYGLGLHLCKKIVKSLNGEITIKSEINQGTEVVITLPISEVE
ncbi:HAMP domain-containing histidine kinase [bacterium]|nr:HAMP domain-containing histidine kinase [bacterium]